AVAIGERDLPDPAVAQRRGDGLAGNGAIDRGGQGDRCVVEEDVGVADERCLERLLNQQTGESTAIDEDVRPDRLPVARAYGGNRAFLIESGVRYMARAVAHSALQRLFVHELPEQHRIEVITVPDIEWKALDGLGCQA